MSRSQPLVSFAVIGVQKGGTSALFHFLSQHPQIGVPMQKELHFFDDDSRPWKLRSYRDYHHYFRRSRGSIRGEATPSYIWWPGALERLAAYNPDMRIIVLFRDPVMRAHAHWRMNRQRGHEVLDFATAIRAGRQRLMVGGPRSRAMRRFSYVERGLYGVQAQRVLEHFRRDQVLMLRQEDLSADHRGTLAQVFDFLGVADHPVPRERVFENNLRVPLEEQDAAYLAALYAEDMACFSRLTGVDTSAWSMLTRGRHPIDLPLPPSAPRADIALAACAAGQARRFGTNHAPRRGSLGGVTSIMPLSSGVP